MASEDNWRRCNSRAKRKQLLGLSICHSSNSTAPTGREGRTGLGSLVGDAHAKDLTREFCLESLAGRVNDPARCVGLGAQTAGQVKAVA
jgi:hypothetical protein